MEQEINKVLQNISFYDGKIDSSLSLYNDLGIDSLRMVELIISIEESLDIQLDESDLDPDTLKYVGDIYKMVSKYKEK